MAKTTSPTERPTLGLVWRGDGHTSTRIIPSNATPLDMQCVPRPLQVSPAPRLVREPLSMAWVWAIVGCRDCYGQPGSGPLSAR